MINNLQAAALKQKLHSSTKDEWSVPAMLRDRQQQCFMGVH
jgi:hypothetical protein